MRFDDRLETILSAERTSTAGAAVTWRQLVDLTGRGVIADKAGAIRLLGDLRAAVPVAVRGASARGLVEAQPSAALVGFFGEDEPVVAAPVLRGAVLADAAWLALLPRLGPAGRAVLRGRDDLSPAVARGLESLGSVDRGIVDARAPVARLEAKPEAKPETPSVEPRAGWFEVADLVARIEASRRGRDDRGPAAMATEFRFVTDPEGVIRWVEGVGRAALVGVSIAAAGQQGLVRIDAGAASALRRRARFADVRLEVGGQSDAAGSWRIAAAPRFDPATGRFTGYGGSGRRPFRHETAASPAESGAARAAMSDGLRQLVHELRTPANAVIGFAELIESQLLGPVPEAYRARAGTIRAQATGLLAAIDDLDVAARIEGGALDLRPGDVPLAALIDRTIADLAPLADRRGAKVALSGDAVAAVDDRAAERLVSRLLAALIAAAQAGERIGVVVAGGGGDAVVTVDRPRAITDVPGDTLFSLDGMAGSDEEGAPLLGAGFTLRLVRNLAVELGGGLAIDPHHLTLRLPAGTERAMAEVDGG